MGYAIGRIQERICRLCHKSWWSNAAGIQHHYDFDCPVAKKQKAEEFRQQTGLIHPSEAGGIIVPTMRVRRK